jgi:linoleoyl-CoA desaturase
MNSNTRWGFWHVAQLGIQLIMSWLLGIAMFIEHHLVDRKLVVQGGVCFFLTQLLPIFTHPDGWQAGLWVHFWIVCWSNAFTLHAFHLSHINEANSSLNYEYKDGVDWGEHQLRTSSNWIPFDWLSVTGMLELQIEHHLFPSLSYAQQRDIRHIVKATAQEFKLPYNEYPSIMHGITAHMDFMWKLGRSPGELEPKLKMR